VSGSGDVGDLGRQLKSSAEGLVREVAGKLDLEGVKRSLSDIEEADRRGRVEADVTSAVPLTDAERSKLEDRLHSRFGGDLQIRYRVEPSIIGGMIVRVGDRYIDGSVASRLGQLREALAGARSG
jgi:F-type H+-transporting ATPase subunit delta